jgi:HEAT repeat protein
VKAWYNIGSDTKKDKSAPAHKFFQELGNKLQIRSLVQNPLFLSLLCSLYQVKGNSLPTRRCLIYNKVINYMLSKWSRNRKYQTESKIQAKMSLLEELAYYFSCKDQEKFSLKKLLKLTNEYLQKDKALSNFCDADSVITDFSENDGILLKRGREGDQYIFFHPTIKEYLTASYLKEIFENNFDKGLEIVRKYYWNFDWHGIISLLAGLISDPIQLILDIRGQKDDIFGSLLTLIGRCYVESAQYSHPNINNIFNKLFDLWYAYPNETYITSILAAIGKLNSQVTNMFLKLLTIDELEIKLHAVNILGEIGNPESEIELIQCLKNDDNRVREQAVLALGKIGFQKSEAILIQTLKDDDRDVRRNAALALGGIHTSSSEKALIEALEVDICSVKYNAISALGKIGTTKSVKALLHAFNDDNSLIRRNAALALAEIGTPESIKALKQSLKSDVSTVRSFAAYALEMYGYPFENKVNLVYVFKDDDALVKNNTISTLKGIGSSESVEALIQVVKEVNNDVRYDAILALGKIGTRKSAKVLVEALKDDDIFAKYFITLALKKTRTPENLNALVQLLKSDNRLDRIFAVKSLGEIGELDILQKIIASPTIDIYDRDVFSLARSLAIRHCNENVDFIPVYL